jgi:hypothetical protein
VLLASKTSWQIERIGGKRLRREGSAERQSARRNEGGRRKELRNERSVFWHIDCVEESAHGVLKREHLSNRRIERVQLR